MIFERLRKIHAKVRESLKLSRINFKKPFNKKTFSSIRKVVLDGFGVGSAALKNTESELSRNLIYPMA